jgi:hypothetical protein
MKKHNKCNLLPEWGGEYLPFRFFFGQGWTIAVVNRGSIGREIHVQATRPIRSISEKIMNSFNCDFYATILPSNKKAINLAMRTGFEYVGQCKIECASTGKVLTYNTYKRTKKWAE